MRTTLYKVLIFIFKYIINIFINTIKLSKGGFTPKDPAPELNQCEDDALFKFGEAMWWKCSSNSGHTVSG